ncbi:MAG: hypothetical protein ACP5JW_02315 [Candidatus Bathyarchaeia archaeon]
MKKVVLYCVAAAVLGILLMLGPLIAFAIFENEKNLAALYLNSFAKQLPEIERTYGSNASSYSSLDIGILAACFTGAFTVYLFAKHRTSLL